MPITTGHLLYARQYAVHRVEREKAFGNTVANEKILDDVDPKELVLRITGESHLLDTPHGEAWEIVNEFEKVYFDEWESNNE